MIATRLLTQRCTIHSKTVGASLDDMGDPVVTETSREWRCWMWQEQRRDRTDNQDIEFEEWRMAIEPAAAGLVDGSARVVVDDVSYEMFGPPWSALNPRTRTLSHVECSLRRTS